MPETRPQALFIGHEIYRSSTYGGSHPLAIPRVSLTTDLCRVLGWLEGGAFRESRRATRDELLRFHDPGYLDALERAETEPPSEADKRRYNFGVNGNPVFPEMFRRPATACGGGLMAAELIAGGGAKRIFNIAGGQHHGRPDRASGFCFLNEPVLTIRALLEKGIGRVFYLDLDAHHGDGVEDAFTENERVFTLSVHEDGRWPMSQQNAAEGPGALGSPVQASLNLPVPTGFSDTDLEYLMETVILPEIARFQPDAIYLQCGADALADDPQSKLSLTNRALWDALLRVADLGKPLLVSGGGGYNPFSVARAWAGVWATLAGREIPVRLPDDAEALLRSVTWRHRRGREAPDHWFTTLADPPAGGQVRDAVKALAEAALTGRDSREHSPAIGA